MAHILGRQLLLQDPLFIEVLKNIYFYLCVCLSAYHICADAHEGQKMESESQELVL